MSIVNECMTVNLQVGVWTGHRLDKAASRKVTAEANADADAARVNKHTVPKESLRAIMTAANALRAHFYTDTLPWKDNGDRVLTRQRYMKFVAEHARLADAFHAAVETFITTEYPKAQEQAAFRMGDLFNPDDYPTADELRRKFYIGLDIDAVTEASDFRVDVDGKADVQARMEAAMQQRIGRAMQDVWTRLSDVLGHFAAKMGSDDIFRDSTVKNLEEIVELLPDLNILNDPALEQIRQDIKQQLIGYDPKDLRKDPMVRTAAAEDAQRIMDSMAGFMNAFGGGA